MGGGFSESKKYYRIIVEADSPDKEIWIGDDEGHLVVKGYGKLDEGLIPGKYVVTFGQLGGERKPFELNKDGMEIKEGEI